jgi:hypothetical protein
MPVERIVEQMITKRELKKFVRSKFGYELDFDATDILGKIETEISKAAETGAKAISVGAKGNIRPHNVTGKLYRTIKVQPSKFVSGIGLINRRAHLEWLVKAGDNEVDYAMHVETGWYNEKTGKRSPAIPFMRTAIARARQLVRNLFISRLKRILR